MSIVRFVKAINVPEAWECRIESDFVFTREKRIYETITGCLGFVIVSRPDARGRPSSTVG
jgi:hypothetical protein